MKTKAFKFSKVYLVIIICILIAIIVAVYIGLSNKDSYTDALDTMDDLIVGMYDERDLSTLDKLVELIPDDSQYVFKVEVLSEPEFDFQSVTQKVKILEVFKGEGASVGDEITVYNANYHYFDDDKLINLGYVNFMKKGDNYLIFLHTKENTELYGEYYSTDSYRIAPIFNYENKDNVTVDSDSAKYGVVKNNEFMCKNQKVLDAFMEYKKKLMDLYGQTTVN